MSVHDRWRGARTGQGRRYEVRWREGGYQRKRRFDTKVAAQDFEAKRRLEPEARRAVESRTLTVDQMMADWLATTKHLRPSTRDGYRVDAAEVVGEFGPRLAKSVRPSEVRTWLARERGASLRRRSLMAMRRAYKMAIADKVLGDDPTAGIPLPRDRSHDMRFLSWDELGTLASMAGTDAPLVWLLGTCGLRLGEALGLDGADVDRLRRRISVRRSYSTSSEGTELGPTKGAKRREVPVSAFVLAMLPDRVGPLFVGPAGDRLNPHNWRARVFQPAAAAAGFGEVIREGRSRRYVGMHPHELRHTAASLAIASGADVKAVQRMLGHASAAMTLDLYGHLWDAQLDTVADRMDEARRAHSAALEGRRAHQKGAEGTSAADSFGMLRDASGGASAQVIPLNGRAKQG